MERKDFEKIGDASIDVSSLVITFNGDSIEPPKGVTYSLAALKGVARSIIARKILRGFLAGMEDIATRATR